jgi:dihydrolipoamide dehydrogenase
LKLSAVPEKLVIIGGGAIGVEYASLFHAFGTKVSIVEMMERLLPSEDSDLGKRIEMSFKRRGIEVHAGAKVSGVTKSGSDVTVKLEKGKVLQGDKLLIAIGRDRNTSGLGLEQSGVALNGDAIEVDGYLETKAQHVFAIGDVTRLPQLAHVASFGGTLVVDNLLKPNKRQVFPAHAIPNCIFSDPLIASVGLTRAVAEKQGIRVREARLLLSSQGKAHVEGELEGFVKLVINENTKTVIGGHVMGGEASEMIGVIALAASECITVDRLANTIFPHPTYHEIIGDAARVLAIES